MVPLYLPYLHVLHLILFPLITFHLVLFQFCSGPHISIIVTLYRVSYTITATGIYEINYSSTNNYEPYNTICLYMYFQSKQAIILWLLVTHPIVDQPTFMKVNDVSTYSIEEVLRVGHQNQNTFIPAVCKKVTV